MSNNIFGYSVRVWIVRIRLFKNVKGIYNMPCSSYYCILYSNYVNLYIFYRIVRILECLLLLFIITVFLSLVLVRVTHKMLHIPRPKHFLIHYSLNYAHLHNLNQNILQINIAMLISPSNVLVWRLNKNVKNGYSRA